MHRDPERDRLLEAVAALERKLVFDLGKIPDVVLEAIRKRQTDADQEPDFPPMEFARIWVPFAETKLVVPVGVFTRCTFGPWAGPTMPLCEIAVHGYFLKDRAPVRGFLGRPDGAPQAAWLRQRICAGCAFEVSLRVSRS